MRYHAGIMNEQKKKINNVDSSTLDDIAEKLAEILIKFLDESSLNHSNGNSELTTNKKL